LASSAETQTASVSLAGYNTAQVTIFPTGKPDKNTFGIVPAGKLYFLSNLSGKLDVVKTNLDGSGRQTVLAGTGKEDRNSTSLLASRDWKYLALLSKRSGDDNASLYLIDATQGDKLSTIDEGNANFSLVGWSGDRFIYSVGRNTIQNWQPNQSALKSFDPTTGHTLLLDQTQGSGSDGNNYARQSFSGVYLVGNQVVYAKTWQGNGSGVLNGKQAEIDTIGADGSGHKVLKSFMPLYFTGNGYESITLNARPYEPSGIYFEFYHDNTQDYYSYDEGAVTDNTTLTNDTFWSDPYPTYLLSPSGNQTFWNEPRDGKSTLLIGNSDGKNSKQVASLSEYSVYGWFTDDYLLVSKNSSELYIMPTTGGTPYKITDYYKPAINYQGYGGGYGGL